MRSHLTISAAGHAAVLVAALLWGLDWFSSKPRDSAPALAVDVVSTTEFSQMRAGAQNAPKTEAPKPLVEKLGETKLSDNPAAKVVEKPEIISASAQVTPPEPTPKPPEPKRTEKKQPDPIAEALKKDETHKPEKKAETKAPTPPKKQPTFDPKQIEKRLALLDKREAQRQAIAGDTINRTPAHGTTTGSAPQLSMSELDAFRSKVRSCWITPVGRITGSKLIVQMTIRLKQDGTLTARPQLETTASDAYSRAMIESAVRAVVQCQPYTMFSPAKYDTWKEIGIDFDPDQMFGPG